MLVYIRESDVDEIMSPVTAEDIPEHLRMYYMVKKYLKLIRIRMIVIHLLCFNREAFRRGESTGRTKEERNGRETSLSYCQGKKTF
jgi:hypothetical protein